METNMAKNIISVVSNKGGVGKTSIAIAAGCYCSQKLKEPTLLLELDCSPGDFGTLFDVDKKNSLEMALRYPDSLKKYVKKINCNLDILMGLQNPMAAESVKKEELFLLLDVIKVNYENIITDTQTVLNAMTLNMLSASKKILLVTDSSIESFNRVINYHDILTKGFFISKNIIKLLVNKKSLKDCLRLWDLAKISGLPVQGFLPFEKNFNKSVFAEGSPAIQRSGFYRQVGKIIENGLLKGVTDVN
jgi:pilus assembly protein CpaE